MSEGGGHDGKNIFALIFFFFFNTNILALKTLNFFVPTYFEKGFQIKDT